MVSRFQMNIDTSGSGCFETDPHPSHEWSMCCEFWIRLLHGGFCLLKYFKTKSPSAVSITIKTKNKDRICGDENSKHYSFAQKQGFVNLCLVWEDISLSFVQMYRLEFPRELERRFTFHWINCRISLNFQQYIFEGDFYLSKPATRPWDNGFETFERSL
jgi:hypothetical protein